jgi:hypothetical protein
VRCTLQVITDGQSFGDGEFGFFSHLGEPWPRGQSSALHICSEVMSKGAWSRAFNAPDWRERFSQPTVEGVDFPLLGIASARNDLSAGELRVETYAASPSAAGAVAGSATRFRLTALEGCDLGGFSATCDGAAFEGFAVHGAEVTVETTVASHSFVFKTGFRGTAGGAGGARL